MKKKGIRQEIKRIEWEIELCNKYQEHALGLDYQYELMNVIHIRNLKCKLESYKRLLKEEGELKRSQTLQKLRIHWGLIFGERRRIDGVSNLNSCRG